MYFIHLFLYVIQMIIFKNVFFKLFIYRETNVVLIEK